MLPIILYQASGMLPALAGFGEKHNQVINNMHIFNGQLYVAVANSISGFQLFKTSAIGSPPFEWEKILDSGAQLYTLNPAVSSMTVFNKALYLGTGILESDPAKVETKGAEIIRVLADGKSKSLWEHLRFFTHWFTGTFIYLRTRFW